MSLILNGTDGLSDVDGTAGTPAIRGTDANTGIFFPAADTIAFSEGGVESMRIDSSGNVGIGTTSPSAKLNVIGGNIRLDNNQGLEWAGSNNYIYGNETTDFIVIATNGNEAMRIDSSSRVGIGTSSPAFKTEIVGGADTVETTLFQIRSNAGGINTGTTIALANSTNPTAGSGRVELAGLRDTASGSSFVVRTANSSGTVTEQMRIDSSGNVLVGTTDSGSTTGVGTKQIANATVPYFINVINDSTGSNYYLLYNTNALNTGYRFYVQANGGIANFSGNNVNLSDERTKTNIEVADSYLNKICSIPVKTFNYKDEPAGEQKTLGVIAQDVEAVAPEFVNNAGFGETKEGETPLKAVYTTDLMFALMKSIQEQQQIINDLKARIETLESN